MPAYNQYTRQTDTIDTTVICLKYGTNKVVLHHKAGTWWRHACSDLSEKEQPSLERNHQLSTQTDTAALTE